MSPVEFFEDPMPKSISTHKEPSGIVGFMISHHLAQSRMSAYRSLIALFSFLILLSIFIFIWSETSSKNAQKQFIEKYQSIDQSKSQ